MRLLFVCTGNICRSPTADAVARRRAADAGLDWHVDSAGTGGWHAGEAPDPRATAAGAGRGYDLSVVQAREVDPADFRRFDHIIAMDGSHLRFLRRMPGAKGGARLSLMMDWAGEPGVEVPDPYYGGDDGFDDVLDMIERAVVGLISDLGPNPGAGPDQSKG
ncbi:low molecular weight protein-tyrosine-phosphatase [Maricaulis sp.]|uniref:low molecular weight protein-tyrosine-phosphatase n=1 Tax=Maricaulis sp. TaxID=1486257 RepID=UPI0025BE2058|nr:low molecular weight protein-tyrosine-phosphatase [Maricaulis sp.]